MRIFDSLPIAMRDEINYARGFYKIFGQVFWHPPHPLDHPILPNSRNNPRRPWRSRS